MAENLLALLTALTGAQGGDKLNFRPRRLEPHDRYARKLAEDAYWFVLGVSLAQPDLLWDSAAGKSYVLKTAESLVLANPQRKLADFAKTIVETRDTPTREKSVFSIWTSDLLQEKVAFKVYILIAHYPQKFSRPQNFVSGDHLQVSPQTCAI